MDCEGAAALAWRHPERGMISPADEVTRRVEKTPPDQ